MWTLHQLKRRRNSTQSTDKGSKEDLTIKHEFSVESGSKMVSSPDDLEKDSRDGTPKIHLSKTKLEPSTSDIPQVELERENEERIGIWGFTKSEIDKFPSLRKRNFWCIQRHSATAMHYDLRMQIDGGTVSWAVPKGLIGISKNGESSRLAVETTIHPISYTTYEGADGRKFSAGRKGGTLLWDIGEYTITRPSSSIDSTSDEEPRSTKRRKRQRDDHDESHDDDENGKYQEDLFRQALYRRVGYGKSQSIHFILHGGKKMTNHHFILILAASTRHTFSASGQIKKTWFLRLPKEVDEYLWDNGGEEGDFWSRSVKTGRTLKQVTEGYTKRPERWKCEEERFKSWFGDED